eukprot:SAG31_NODE_42898_length_269_cov_0.917647_1_plen_49_part_10
MQVKLAKFEALKAVSTIFNSAMGSLLANGIFTALEVSSAWLWSYDFDTH